MTDAANSFAHLHCHTSYSLLDGLADVDALAKDIAAKGMTAVAQTDHGNNFGSYHFWKAAREAGVKPIIGSEVYLTPQTHRTDRNPVKFGNGVDDVGGKGAYTHMTVWAETNEGMANLFKLNSLASLEGLYYKPRVDRELLSRHATGLIASTGCVGGEVQTLLRHGHYERARAAAGELRDIFGAGNFFAEFMDHGIEIERRTYAELERLAKDVGLPVVATNDLHYVDKADAGPHAALLCVQTNANIDDPKRFKFDSDEFYVKTAAEMRHLFKDMPQACDNTLLIAERCNVEFSHDPELLPRFPVPEGETEASWFTKEVQRGLEFRFPRGIPAEVQAQADYEVATVIQMGFPGYFLVTADFIVEMKNRGRLVGPGRGSAAGAMVAYAMRITDLDPMRHRLVFERFLNPERVSMPDIDVDFDEQTRGEVIGYVTEKYGADKVAQIVTFGKIKAKAAVKDSARVLGYPYAVGDRITKALPPSVMGKDIPLSGVFDPGHKRFAEAGELRSLYESDPDVRKVVDTARGLEGATRGTGVHAAGVIMSSQPLIDVIPIMRRESDGAIITQFEYPTCEDLGLLKMDFLGLSNLNTVDMAVKNVKANRGVDVDLDDLIETLDDRKTYDLLSAGDTLGVFQLDGGPMRDLLRRMRPDNFEDISAVLALYRPGPMGANAHNDYADRKNGRKPVVPIHAELAEPLKEILGDTYGLIVYQEQVMAIAQKLAGYSLGKADLLRRAMGKKKKEILDKEYDGFAAGMKANGYSEAAVATLWEILVPFSDYAFNKAHTAAYGVISYWTAYLKANYPAEYMAALLSTNSDDKDKTAIYLAECRRMGIRVLSPDVNESAAEYAAVGDDVRVGLAAIRGVGRGVVESLVATRAGKGKYADFPDFLSKIEPVVCTKKVVEALIKSGAFDSLGHARRALFTVHESAVDGIISQKKQEALGQDSLFGGGGGEDMGSVAVRVPADVEEWDPRVLLAFEREMIGLYVSGHPLSGSADSLAAQATVTVAGLLEDPRQLGQTVTVGGLITSVERKVTKKGDTWAKLVVEDLTGSIGVLCFPQSYQQVAEMLAPDAILLLTGRAEQRDEEPVALMLSSASVPDLALSPRDARPLVLHAPAARLTPETVGRLREILHGHRGDRLVVLRMTSSDGKTTVLQLSDECRVGNSPNLISEIKAVLGPDALHGPDGPPAAPPPPRQPWKPRQDA